MGMFDYIQRHLYCPYCGHLIDEQFQTKNFENFLWKLKLKFPISWHTYNDEARIYSSCKKCKSWVELVISKSNVRLPTDADRKKRTKTMKEFSLKKLAQFSKRTKKAWKEHDEGKFISKPKGKFLKELKRW